MTRTMETARDALAALDFGPENAALAELSTERASLSDAINRAEERCSEIARLKYDATRKARDVADALVGGATAIEAVTLDPGPEQMEEERLSLRAAIRELSERLRGVEERRAEILKLAGQKPHQAIKPVIATLHVELVEAAEKVAGTFAALRAIQTATGFGRAEADAAEFAVAGLFGQGRAVSWRKSVAVPAEVQNLLAALEGNGTAYPARVISAVPIP